jgi:cell division protease FtsH
VLSPKELSLTNGANGTAPAIETTTPVDTVKEERPES